MQDPLPITKAAFSEVAVQVPLSESGSSIGLISAFEKAGIRLVCSDDQVLFKRENLVTVFTWC